MDREWGAQDALAFVRRTDFAPSALAFDAAMQRSGGVSERTTGSAPKAGVARRRRDPGDRRRDARLRLHGQGALERVPQARVHDVAAAAPAAARLDRGAQRGGGRERGRAATASSARRPTGASSSPTRRSGCFDNNGPNNLHAEPTIAAAEAGKHVICEKPLGRDADESFEIWQRVAATGVKHMCAFNYRFVPAVRLAREMIDAGELGEIRHFRGRYLQDWGDDPALDTWRFNADEAGSGALGDLGAHVVDLAHFLVGGIASVSALARDVPAAAARSTTPIEAAVEFENGAVGTIEATRLALGPRNALRWEINGSKGSLAFDLERLNELQVSAPTATARAASRRCRSRSPTIRSGSTGGRRAT